MSKFSITSADFEEGGEIPKKFGYKHGNEVPLIIPTGLPVETESVAIIMDDPDAMKAVGKVWVHYLTHFTNPPAAETGEKMIEEPDIEGLNDFGEIGYGGPAPPDGRHTYIFKAYALDIIVLDLKEGFSKQELEDAMKGHILAEATLAGTYAP